MENSQYELCIEVLRRLDHAGLLRYIVLVGSWCTLLYQALRFLDFLAQNTITVGLQEITVTVPHPVHFALHKLLVLGRRPTREKQAKDKETATKILQALIDKGEGDLLGSTFSTMPQRWQTRVKKQLTDLLDRQILDVLQR